MAKTKLLFDLYGVLMRLPSAADRLLLEETLGVQDSARFWDTYEELRPPYDAGLVSDERWWTTLARRSGLGDIDTSQAVAADIAGCLEADTEMVGFVQSLIDAGHSVGILSNIPTGLAAVVRREHPWLEDFAAVTLSCDIGVAKPEEQAYLVAVDALGGTLKDTLFFDDRDDFVRGAREAGLRAERFDGIDSVRKVLSTP